MNFISQPIQYWIRVQNKKKIKGPETKKKTYQVYWVNPLNMWIG